MKKKDEVYAGLENISNRLTTMQAGILNNMYDISTIKKEMSMTLGMMTYNINTILSENNMRYKDKVNSLLGSTRQKINGVMSMINENNMTLTKERFITYLQSWKKDIDYANELVGLENYD